MISFYQCLYDGLSWPTYFKNSEVSTMFKKSALLFSVCLLGAACISSSVDKVSDEGQYWQRVNTAETVYMRGAKAQQLLNRDISRCVVELRELERLGALRDTIPTDSNGRLLNPDEIDIANQDSPERDRYLFAEHKDFNDFESCMLSVGWERVKYVPYDVAEQAGHTYISNHVILRDHHKKVEARRERKDLSEKFND